MGNFVEGWSKDMINLKNISFQYDNAKEESLENINLEVKQGECVLLCGESGCGKTTVTRLINGLIPHFYEGKLEGESYVDKLNIRKTPLEEISKKVGSVFQNPRSQFFCVDTTGEIAFGLENTGMSEREILDRVNRATEQLQVKNLLYRNIFNLSGGEKQKIACAGVSAVEPDIIVLDEPTSNLDEDAIAMLRNILLLWKSEGKTIVIAEHRLHWLCDVVDRVIYMEKGRIVKDFTQQEFFAKSNRELNLLGLRGLKKPHNYLDSDIGFFCINLENTEKFRENEAYTLSDFHYKYDRKEVALELAQMEIPKHSVVAVVGHNGAGKSTFSKCLCGIQRGFKGSIIINNKKYRGKKLRNLCYMVMQDVNHQLFTDSVLEEVTLGLSGDEDALAEKVLEKMDLSEVKERHPMSLSGGQKQRTAICSAYLSDREIIIFDEPTSGLDFKRMQQTANLIREISKEKTVFIVTHDMELIEECCTHILHIENGHIND